MVDLTDYIVKLKKKPSGAEIDALVEMMCTARDRLGAGVSVLKGRGLKGLCESECRLGIGVGGDFFAHVGPYLQGRKEVGAFEMLELVKQCVKERDGNIDCGPAGNLKELSTDDLIDFIKSARKELTNRTQGVL